MSARIPLVLATVARTRRNTWYRRPSGIGMVQSIVVPYTPIPNEMALAAAVVVLFWGPGYLSVDEPGGRAPSSDEYPDD